MFPGLSSKFEMESDEEKKAVSTAQKFLEDNVGSIVDPYTAALTAYALTLRNSQFAAIAVRVLSSKAIRRGETARH